MKAPLRLALLCALGPLAAACLDNRPIIVGEKDGGSPSQTGAAGSQSQPGTGTAGNAGVTGSAGMTGGTGTAGSPGATTARGCDITPLIATNTQPQKYLCTIAGACHDAAQSATGLDMTSVGWERKLVGTFPANGSQTAVPSLCLDSTEPYLVAGSSPARGLFLDKLKPNPPCGAQMPNLGSHVSAEDMDCFQRWANALTAP